MDKIIKTEKKKKSKERKEDRPRNAWLGWRSLLCSVYSFYFVYPCTRGLAWNNILVCYPLGPWSVPYVVCYDFFRPLSSVRSTPHLVNLPQVIYPFSLSSVVYARKLILFFTSSVTKRKAAHALHLQRRHRLRNDAFAFSILRTSCLPPMTAYILRLDLQGEDGLYLNNGD